MFILSSLMQYCGGGSAGASYKADTERYMQKSAALNADAMAPAPPTSNSINSGYNVQYASNDKSKSPNDVSNNTSTVEPPKNENTDTKKEFMFVNKKRLLIYKAELDLEVKDIEETQKKILEYINKIDGFLLSMSDEMMTVKVPAEKFDEVIATIIQLGILLRKNIFTEDVTKRYSDLLIRLENSVAAKERLIELLKKASAVDEILKIEEQLLRLTQDIELIKGELNYLKENIMFSTITINYSLSREVLESRQARSTGSYSTPFSWVNDLGLERLKTMY